MTTAAFPTGKVPGQEAVMECFFFFLATGGVGIYMHIHTDIHTFIPKKQIEEPLHAIFFKRSTLFFF